MGTAFNGTGPSTYFNWGMGTAKAPGPAWAVLWHYPQAWPQAQKFFGLPKAITRASIGGLLKAHYPQYWQAIKGKAPAQAAIPGQAQAQG
jgi:hypothetical protein